MGEFKCRRCGACCKQSWDIPVNFQKDVLRWIEEKRFDILKHVVLNPKFILSPAHFNNEPQWIIDCGHVLFGDEHNKCPFLAEADLEGPAKCRIKETWPEVCRRFPFHKNGEIRTDVLDICVGSIFYHSREAELESLNFIEYMEKISHKNVKDFSQAPRREELLEIARFFKGRDLKVNFTSDTGLEIAEKMLSKTRFKILKETRH
jgi:Fe-S-cluster containining protein